MTKILKATCHGCWGVILFQLEGWRTAATEECGLRSGCQTQHSSATTELSPIIKAGCPIQDSSPTDPVTPESDWCQNSRAASPQILHHTVWRTWLFTAYSDERWLYYQFSLHHSHFFSLEVGRMYFLSLGVTGLIWGAGIRQMNCDTREQGMNQSINSMSSSGLHSTKPSPGVNYSTTDSHNSIYAVDQGGNNQIWTIGNIINKNRTILYLIRPAEAERTAQVEMKQGQNRGATLLTKTHFQTVMFNHACTDFWKLPKLCSHEACTDFQSFVIRKVVLQTQCAPFRYSSSLAMVEGWISRLTTFPCLTDWLTD